MIAYDCIIKEFIPNDLELQELRCFQRIPTPSSMYSQKLEAWRQTTLPSWRLYFFLNMNCLSTFSNKRKAHFAAPQLQSFLSELSGLTRKRLRVVKKTSGEKKTPF